MFLTPHATMEFRADIESDSWHYCRDCQKWPDKPRNVLNLHRPPRNIKLCPECQKLAPLGSARSRSKAPRPPRR